MNSCPESKRVNYQESDLKGRKKTILAIIDDYDVDTVTSNHGDVDENGMMVMTIMNNVLP